VDDPEPEWFPDPAVGRLTVTSPHEERAFRGYNAIRPYTERVRPWNFLRVAHPDFTERAAGGPTTLVGPYTKQPRNRMRNPWFDRRSVDGKPLRIRTGRPEYVIPGTVVVQSYGDYFEEYRTHPEAKAADSRGRACGPWSKGLLQPRYVEASRIIRVGKRRIGSRRTPSSSSSLRIDRWTIQSLRPAGPALCHCTADSAIGARRLAGSVCSGDAWARGLASVDCGWRVLDSVLFAMGREGLLAASPREGRQRARGFAKLREVAQTPNPSKFPYCWRRGCGRVHRVPIWR